MKKSAQRNLIRWLHIIIGSILATYVYSPWNQIAVFQLIVKGIAIPVIILSGLWLWKGHLLRNPARKK
ncbi:MAG: hypothetical protein MUC87_04210 [Bacteroidia bacterium]|jgi:hypothetical protein|nr:hypothetical protein [Bacteroidia bacterium]